MVGLLNNSKIFIILLLALFGCTDTVTVNKKEAFAIIKVWRESPVNVHQEISPRYKALLNNGDTVPCSPIARIGDTVYYKYYKVK